MMIADVRRRGLLARSSSSLSFVKLKLLSFLRPQRMHQTPTIPLLPPCSDENSHFSGRPSLLPMSMKQCWRGNTSREVGRLGPDHPPARLALHQSGLDLRANAHPFFFLFATIPP
jgi:hypothetical protein